MSVSSILANGVKTIEYGQQFSSSDNSRCSEKSLLDLIELTLEASSFAEIHHLCKLASWKYGFNTFGLGVLTPTLSEGMVLAQVYTYSSEWTRRYNEKRYMAVDPFAMHCVDNTAPLIWRNTHPIEQFGKNARKMVTEAIEYGMNNTVQIPMRGAMGGLGGIRFSNFNDENMKDSDVHAALPELFYWCAFLHGAIDKAMKNSHHKDVTVRLSAREKEVLRWAACGKEACVISDILNISETTVLTHFKNAYLKLGVRTRQHAVAKALNLRLIYI